MIYISCKEPVKSHKSKNGALGAPPSSHVTCLCLCKRLPPRKQTPWGSQSGDKGCRKWPRHRRNVYQNPGCKNCFSLRQKPLKAESCDIRLMATRNPKSGSFQVPGGAGFLPTTVSYGYHIGLVEKTNGPWIFAGIPCLLINSSFPHRILALLDYVPSEEPEVHNAKTLVSIGAQG